MIADLIAAVHAAGGSIVRRGNEIKLTAAAALPDDLMAQIRARKPELIAHLAEDRPTFSRPNGFQGCLWPESNGSSFRWCGAPVDDPMTDEFCADHHRRRRN
jgi:hypothetical protein